MSNDMCIEAGETCSSSGALDAMIAAINVRLRYFTPEQRNSILNGLDYCYGCGEEHKQCCCKETENEPKG